MRSIFSVARLFVCSALFALVACSDEPVTNPTDDKQPTANPTTVAVRIERSNDLALDLYNQLKDTEGNLILSPHSITTAFGMVYAGARGITKREIAKTLHFNYPPVDFHTVLRQLNDILEARGSTVGPESFRLNISCSAWGREDAFYLPSYLDTISVNYGTNLQFLDFGNQPEASRATINQWVEDETESLIKDLLLPGSIHSATYLVLVNTIYFKASWLYQFDPDYTYRRAFTRLDGSEVQVPVMSGETYFYYDQGDGYSAVGLPYKGEECTMVLILPDEGEFENFEASFTAAKLDTIVGELREMDVIVKLPRFSFETEYDLVPTLKAMGMNTAFSPGANFSGIDGTDDGLPWIDFVAHKAFISVDEFGTMAAAATGIGFTVGMPPVFDAVRPFIFVIRDDETGTILFLGRVLDPSP